MNKFELSCCHLFEQHPLYKYRVSQKDPSYTYVLNVLLIGSGTRLESLLNEVLIYGQLPDTELHITYLTKQAGRTADRLLSKMPYAPHFINITADRKVPDSASFAGSRCLASLDILSVSSWTDPAAETFSTLMKDPSCKYIIVSTGKEDLNIQIAESCSNICLDDAVIAYVCSSKAQIAEINHAFPFGYQADTGSLQSLEQIGYNLHYAYCKSQNSRIPQEQIAASFKESYNYLSSLKSAMHIKSKLASCGIETKDLKEAASSFHTLLKNNPGIVDALAMIEHNRWIMEKITSGYRQLEKLSMIYKGNEITTHNRDPKNLWHICLVPCNAESHIKESEWDKPINNKDHHLDDLDLISLKIHDICGKAAKENRLQIETIMKNIHDSIEQQYWNREDILSAQHSLEQALSQIWQKKRSALAIYERNLSFLKSTLKCDNSHSSSMLIQLLETMDQALKPQKEYISYKDYKEQDRISIRQIPFALTHKRHLCLGKLLASKETESVLSICRLVPEKVIFAGMVTDTQEFQELREHIMHIDSFLVSSYSEVTQEYHILLPDNNADLFAEKLTALSLPGLKLYKLPAVDYQTVATAINGIFSNARADYVDITGGHPLLVKTIDEDCFSIIAHRNGTLFNVKGADEVAYTIPARGITVKEMFDISGAVLQEESDSSRLSDFSSKYQKFWNIAKQERRWVEFCKHITKEYNYQMPPAINLPDLPANAPYESGSVILHSEAAIALIPILRKLKGKKYLKNFQIRPEFEGHSTITFEIKGRGTVNKFKQVLLECANQFTPGTYYLLKSNNEHMGVMHHNLYIDNLPLSPDSSLDHSFKKTIKQLADSKLFINYNQPDDYHCSFQFASIDILDALQVSGKVLEWYIYYTALLECQFDDVEMGWHFNHSADEDAADNELDIICTKGSSSFFISAKMISPDNVDLKFLCYEISLMADRFGLNAAPIIAMPKAEQFQANPKTGNKEFSNYVKQAFRRGVYLLGKECFEKNNLAKVLNNIAEKKEDWCDFLK